MQSTPYTLETQKSDMRVYIDRHVDIYLEEEIGCQSWMGQVLTHAQNKKKVCPKTASDRN